MENIITPEVSHAVTVVVAHLITFVLGILFKKKGVI
jgi:hypothetical protein